MIDTDTKSLFWGSRNREVFRSTTAEGMIGLGAVILAIIGLSNIIPMLLVSIACIAVGVALAFEGGALSARYSALIEMGDEINRTDIPIRWGGITSLFLGGAAGIAMGVLSLIGIIPMILIPVSTIVFGSALIMDSGANTRLSVLEARHSEEFKSKENVIRETAQDSAGIEVLVGMASIILGILALIGFNPLVLSLVALLSIGAANSFTGALLGGGISRIFRR